MYYVLFYTAAENYVEKRAPYREAHLNLARAAHARGELVIAGALADPPDSAILVFKGNNPSVAENFAKHDPYVENGAVIRWNVRPWTVVIGGDNAP